jgi:hypothetical protein
VRQVSVAAVEAESIGLPHVRSVIEVVRSYTENGQPKQGRRWFASSLSVEEIGDGRALQRVIRAHWSVENCNHWPRDANWKEDKTRCRSKPLARVLAVLRGPMITLLAPRGESLPTTFASCARQPRNALNILSTKHP